MRENNIQSIVRKKFRKPKDKSIIKENVLSREFGSSHPGKKIVTDINYILREVLFTVTKVFIILAILMSTY